jgi:ATP-dependent helicase/DNAse subunit B
VAVLGLAEGEFPATLGEDPFLRDADRQRLREEFGLPLEPSTLSAEFEFFYETVTRPRERLLLTRPRLAENGAEWQASPFWEEVRRLVAVEPRTLTSESLPLPVEVASWPELMDSLAGHPTYDEVRAWTADSRPDRRAAVDAAVDLLRLRRSRATGSPFDGDLGGLGDDLAHRFGPHRSWSASRLETYRTCPFFYFVSQVLHLEPRPEPAEGLDARQLGNIYHHIFEQVYQHPGVGDPADLDQVLAVLPEVAGAVLDAAPQQEGFRETAWWAQTRREILENVRRSLEALAELPGGYAPALHEAVFGRKGQPPLVVRQGEDSFWLGGYIDRVDRAPDGRVRVVDYKTAGPWSFSKKAVAEGKKLQLPLYALAARDALRLGEIAGGFYWHVGSGRASYLRLEKVEGGVQGSIDTALAYAWATVRAVRTGAFAPRPPAGGCPGHCPAAAFCWRYVGRRW